MNLEGFKALPGFFHSRRAFIDKLNTQKRAFQAKFTNSQELYEDLHRSPAKLSLDAKVRKLNNKLVARLSDYVIKKYKFDLYKNWTKGLPLTFREKQLALDFLYRMPDSQNDFFKAKKKLLNNIRNNLFRAKVSDIRVEEITNKDDYPFTREINGILEIKAINFAVKLTIKDNPKLRNLVPKIDMLVPDDLRKSNINLIEVHLAKNKVKDKHLGKLVEFRDRFYEKVR